MDSDDFYDEFAPESPSAIPSLGRPLDVFGYQSGIRASWSRLANAQAAREARGSSNFLSRWGQVLKDPGWAAASIVAPWIVGPTVVATNRDTYGTARRYGLSGCEEDF